MTASNVNAFKGNVIKPHPVSSIVFAYLTHFTLLSLTFVPRCSALLTAY